MNYIGRKYIFISTEDYGYFMDINTNEKSPYLIGERLRTWRALLARAQTLLPEREIEAIFDAEAQSVFHPKKNYAA